MQKHPVYGLDVITRAERDAGAHDDAILEMAKDIVYTHHERWDGKGYPRGLKGEQIPVAGRLIAIVDVYDAMTTRRFTGSRSRTSRRWTGSSSARARTSIRRWSMRSSVSRRSCATSRPPPKSQSPSSQAARRPERQDTAGRPFVAQGFTRAGADVAGLKGRGLV